MIINNDDSLMQYILNHDHVILVVIVETTATPYLVLLLSTF